MTKVNAGPHVKSCLNDPAERKSISRGRKYQFLVSQRSQKTWMQHSRQTHCILTKGRFAFRSNKRTDVARVISTKDCGETSHERHHSEKNICIQFDCFAAARCETLLGWRQTCAVSDCVQICLALSEKPISFIHFLLDFAPSVNKADGMKYRSWKWRTAALFCHITVIKIHNIIRYSQAFASERAQLWSPSLPRVQTLVLGVNQGVYASTLWFCIAKPSGLNSARCFTF